MASTGRWWCDYMDMDKLLIDCVSYFKGNKAYRRILVKIKDKYISIGKFSGTIKLENMTEDEKNALVDLLGQKFYLNKSYTIKVTDFVESLKHTKFENVDFYEMLCMYFGEKIIINKDIDEINRLKKDRFFNELKNSVDGDIYNFIMASFTNKDGGCYSLLNNKYNDDGSGKKLLKELIFLSKIINKINCESKLRLAILASDITNNPHALDENTFLNKILPYYLCRKGKYKFPKNAEEKNTLLYENNILKDDISNNTLVSGVFAYILQDNKLVASKSWNVLTENYEPFYLSLMNLNKIDVLKPMGNKVLIVENPTFFMKLYEIIFNSHNKMTLICSNGQINLSTLVILDMLSKNDCMLCYSGDYDPEGLLIADRLLERYKDKIEPIFYSEEIYLSIISNVNIEDRRLKQLDKIKDKRLIPIAECIKRQKRSAYQEGINIDSKSLLR